MRFAFQWPPNGGQLVPSASCQVDVIEIADRSQGPLDIQQILYSISRLKLDFLSRHEVSPAVVGDHVLLSHGTGRRNRTGTKDASAFSQPHFASWSIASNHANHCSWAHAAIWQQVYTPFWSSSSRPSVFASAIESAFVHPHSLHFDIICSMSFPWPTPFADLRLTSLSQLRIIMSGAQHRKSICKAQ
jgi:hypothetical protein